MKRLLLAAAFMVGSLQAEVTELTAKNFKEATQTGICIVDVYAEWCSPCQQMKPIFEQFAQDMKDTYLCAKIDFDTNKDLMGTLGVTALPSFLIIKDGEVVGNVLGFQPIEQLKVKIQDILIPVDFSKLTKEELEAKLGAAAAGVQADTIEKIIEAGILDADSIEKCIAPHMMVLIMNAFQQPDAIIKIFATLRKVGAEPKVDVPAMGRKITAQEWITEVLMQMRTTLAVVERVAASFEDKRSVAIEDCANGVCAIE